METTPVRVMEGVLKDESGMRRRGAMANLFGAEIQHIVIQHLAILKQKITEEPVLLDLLKLTGSPDRILIKTECCKSPAGLCPCERTLTPTSLSELCYEPIVKSA